MKIPSTLVQETYVPIIPDRVPHLTVAHSWKTLPVAMRATPQQPCGSAQRVGYTGAQNSDLAIYRLRIKYRRRSFMLPGLFVLKQGVFTLYEYREEGADV